MAPGVHGDAHWGTVCYDCKCMFARLGLALWLLARAGKDRLSMAILVAQWLTSRRDAPPDAATVLKAEAERNAIRQRAAALEDADVGQRLRVSSGIIQSPSDMLLLSQTSGGPHASYLLARRSSRFLNAACLCRRTRMACSPRQQHTRTSCPSLSARHRKQQMHQSRQGRSRRRRRLCWSRRSLTLTKALAHGCRPTGPDATQEQHAVGALCLSVCDAGRPCCK